MGFTARQWIVCLIAVVSLVGGAAGISISWAQGPMSVVPDQVECIPVGGNGVVWASVNNNRPETSVKLYFRRLHDTVEDTEVRLGDIEKNFG